MICPRCGSDMAQMERHAVVLDVCSGCGGMWLDKGELAKVLKHVRDAETSLDAELNAGNRGGQAQYPPPYRHEHDEHHHERKHDHDRRYGYGHPKKTGLQKLFDIFD